MIGEDHGYGWGRTWGPGIEINWSEASIEDVIDAALGRVQWLKMHKAHQNRPSVSLTIDNLHAAKAAVGNG